jgi:hypothetical protein
MPTTGIIQGRLMKVNIGGVVLDDQLDTNISMTSDMDEVTTKNSGNYKAFLPSFVGATASASGYISFDAVEGISEAFAAIKAGTPLTFLLSTGVTGDATFTSSAFLTTWNVDFPKDGIAGFSFDYQFTGEPIEGVVA